MANPGPASQVTQQTVAGYTPVNTSSNPAMLLSNARRLLAVARGVSLATTGDILQMPVINALTWAATDIVVANAVGGSAATGNITINTGAAVTGTSVRTAGVLTGVTGPLTLLAAAAANLAVINTAQSLFVNGTVALAGVTVDIFVYGYDLT